MPTGTAIGPKVRPRRPISLCAKHHLPPPALEEDQQPQANRRDAHPVPNDRPPVPPHRPAAALNASFLSCPWRNDGATAGACRLQKKKLG